MRLGLFAAFLLIYHGAWARDNLPTSSCSPQSLIDARLRANLSEIAYTLESERAPFNYSCQSEDSTKGRPKTGLFKRAVPLRDQQGHQSADFLRLVESKIRAKIANNKNMVKSVKTCMASAAPDCTEIKNWVEKSLPDYVGTARFHLSLAQSAHQVKTWLGLTSTQINSNLDSLGSPKLKSWKPLSAQEKNQAEKAIRIYQEQIKKEHKNASPYEKKQALLVLRYQHFEQYQAMMAQLPFLQYIDSANPTGKDVLSAINELEESIKQEEAALSKINAALKETPPGTNALNLLRYTTLVEQTLIERPEYCAIATSLVFTNDNRELGNSLAIGLPILAVSIFAPPVAISLGASGLAATGVGVGIGVVGSAGFIYDSQRLLNQERVRSFSQFYGEETGSELEQVRMAESMRNFQVITAPLAFSGGGALVKTALVHTGAIKLASKIPLAIKRP